MKTKNAVFAIAMVVFAFLSMNATWPKETPKKAEVKAITTLEEAKQCGVTESQIISYLQNCSHHHTVYWLQDIPGTCNTRAGIENCGVATVYVVEGIIISHTDSNLNCD